MASNNTGMYHVPERCLGSNKLLEVGVQKFRLTKKQDQNNKDLYVIYQNMKGKFMGDGVNCQPPKAETLLLSQDEQQEEDVQWLDENDCSASSEEYMLAVDETVQNDSVRISLENTDKGHKTCRICRSSEMQGAKHLLTNASKGKTYKEIIQETVKIEIICDNSNLSICKSCSTFIEDLSDFVRQCHDSFFLKADAVIVEKIVNIDFSDDDEDFHGFETNLLEVASTEEIIPLEQEILADLITEETIIEEILIEAEEANAVESFPADVPKAVRKIKDHRLHKDGKPEPTKVRQKPKQCEVCGRIVRRDLLQHMKTHSGMRIKCKICGKYYTNEKQLHVHMNLHTKEIQYPCKFCDRVFYIWKSHKEHEQTHLDKINKVEHKCSECGLLYSNKKQMEVHFKLKHLGIRKHACTQCDFRTNQRDRLLHHVRCRHTDMRPYMCTVCGNTSSNDANHYIHFQRHKKKDEANVYQIKCAYCSEVYLKDAAFENHLLESHPEKAVTV